MSMQGPEARKARNHEICDGGRPMSPPDAMGDRNGLGRRTPMTALRRGE